MIMGPEVLRNLYFVLHTIFTVLYTITACNVDVFSYILQCAMRVPLCSK